MKFLYSTLVETPVDSYVPEMVSLVDKHDDTQEMCLLEIDVVIRDSKTNRVLSLVDGESFRHIYRSSFFHIYRDVDTFCPGYTGSETLEDLCMYAAKEAVLDSIRTDSVETFVRNSLPTFIGVHNFIFLGRVSTSILVSVVLDSYYLDKIHCRKEYAWVPIEDLTPNTDLGKAIKNSLAIVKGV